MIDDPRVGTPFSRALDTCAHFVAHGQDDMFAGASSRGAGQGAGDGYGLVHLSGGRERTQVGNKRSEAGGVLGDEAARSTQKIGQHHGRPAQNARGAPPEALVHCLRHTR